MDKGLVLDAYVRVALVGIDVLTIDARVVMASIDTYLEFADAVDRLSLSDTEPGQLTDLLDEVTEGPIGSKATGVLEAAGDTLRGAVSGATEGKRPSRRRRGDPGFGE